ncbi:MAG: hypothetical protein LBL19_07690 [Spirochaetaceae bacterium]|jgi:uncharacterized membrane protein YcgQ (UPF0703/DUF1980 family)|nr:hypothetical protein [Spirochaetaceae bacterium]
MKKPLFPAAAGIGGIILLLAALGGCGNRSGGAPKNQAGTAPVIIPGYSAPSVAGENASGELLTAEPAQKHSVLERGASAGESIIEIKEKLFIAQTNDVYLNPEDYLGKTIKLEGLFKSETGYDADYCFVIRYGPGCCGSDGNAGFEVAWDNPSPDSGDYPEEDAWVEAVGVLDSYDENGYPYLYLSLASLTVKEPRGAEFVSQ